MGKSRTRWTPVAAACSRRAACRTSTRRRRTRTRRTWSAARARRRFRRGPPPSAGSATAPLSAVPGCSSRRSRRRKCPLSRRTSFRRASRRPPAATTRIANVDDTRNTSTSKSREKCKNIVVQVFILQGTLRVPCIQHETIASVAPLRGNRGKRKSSDDFHIGELGLPAVDLSTTDRMNVSMASYFLPCSSTRFRSRTLVSFRYEPKCKSFSSLKTNIYEMRLFP